MIEILRDQRPHPDLGHLVAAGREPHRLFRRRRAYERPRRFVGVPGPAHHGRAGRGESRARRAVLIDAGFGGGIAAWLTRRAETIDSLLGGRLSLVQRPTGHRAGHRCGSAGAAASGIERGRSLRGYRWQGVGGPRDWLWGSVVRGATGVLLEADAAAAARLARENCARNGLDARIRGGGSGPLRQAALCAPPTSGSTARRWSSAIRPSTCPTRSGLRPIRDGPRPMFSCREATAIGYGPCWRCWRRRDVSS